MNLFGKEETLAASLRFISTVIHGSEPGSKLFTEIDCLTFVSGYLNDCTIQPQVDYNVALENLLSLLQSLIEKATSNDFAAEANMISECEESMNKIISYTFGEKIQ